MSEQPPTPLDEAQAVQPGQVPIRIGTEQEPVDSASRLQELETALANAEGLLKEKDHALALTSQRLADAVAKYRDRVLTTLPGVAAARS